MSEDNHDPAGKFVVGNTAAVGHGRPRRPIEIEYWRILRDAVSLDNWKSICAKAAIDAIAGDSKAREFIASRLLGDERVSLVQLSVLDTLDIDSEEITQRTAAAELKEASDNIYQVEVGMSCELSTAARMMAGRLIDRAQAERDERNRAEDERKAERKAQRAARITP